MGRLERKLDIGLINKILSGWKPIPGSWRYPEQKRNSGAGRRRSSHYRGWIRAMGMHRPYLERKAKFAKIRTAFHNARRPRRPAGYATEKVLT